MRNPFRRRRPIRTADEARQVRAVVIYAKLTAVEAVMLGRAYGMDDLLIIERARQADEIDGTSRGGAMFAREVARLVHKHPSEGEML